MIDKTQQIFKIVSCASSEKKVVKPAKKKLCGGEKKPLEYFLKLLK
jgi:hypothetical protein